ncbi:MAG: DUF934 domain-containing protein [Polaromonas sp.]|nr:DUF934 domain-containing protein [Polaromonas sp.]
MKLIAACACEITAKDQNDSQTLRLSNTEDPRDHPLAGIARIDLHFPKFSDGRAFSQAFLLSRRLDFKGEIRATGDVLVDQLAQMQRSGFTCAALRADQDLALAERVLASYPGQRAGSYQGDAVRAHPRFAAVSA